MKMFLEKLKAQKTILVLLLAVLLLSTAGSYFYFKSRSAKNDIYARFSAEVYDTIKQNYWKKITDQELSGLFKLAGEKAFGSPQSLDKQDKQGVAKMILRMTKGLGQDQKKTLVLQISDLVLANLQPFGRSRLYTQKQETQMRETVKNIDKGVDLYQSLGIAKDASLEQINKAYEQKKAELLPKKDTSPEAAQELAMAERAFAALSEKETRESYDQNGIEPTVSANLVDPDIAYIKLSKLSPQSFEEFQKTANKIDKTANPTALILDLRENVGGAIDLLQYFLGPFIGQNQLAYEFFHQDDYAPFRTLAGWLPSLVRYKKVIVLIDSQTQSSAEVMAAVLKKYNVGVLVGVPTKGWGTVENTFEIKQSLDPLEKYSVFMVHSLTLRDDSQPIEGKGVDPTININDQDWQKQLWQYFNYPQLTTAVEKLLEK